MSADDTKMKPLHRDLLPTSQEIGMMCTIDGEMFFKFMKHAWISDLHALCNVTINDSGLHDVTNINELLQGGSGNTPATKILNYK